MGCERCPGIKCLSDCSVIAIYFFFVCANTVYEVGTMPADVVRCVHKLIGLELNSLLNLRHIAAKILAVSLAAKTGNTHQMVVANLHHFTNFLRRPVSSAATTILIASNGINGNTHQPRMVSRLAGWLFFA